ncbi:hypothetical protein TBLA_0A04490 [Henningerozyma blattae CBS 6284]|uniref:Cyclin-like domain-containing protein n=1 Tax=Henningerozyma blattae (strain ATCC 34711 / CBS 6284 / DSM 70876 / NBRC 10599 / NRRL Y-10934 / UCD 77-7) TaxID=1071380 RepID=I2GVU1_HENB6|nr:hypothetical protein TBLA_0A04490 [Tetrapisispora blattae CBS 6284]CCH58243.1 hypothetical protein TBLA_0A04490 [Tetrapisispora blattae CBS 6284]
MNSKLQRVVTSSIRNNIGTEQTIYENQQSQYDNIKNHSTVFKPVAQQQLPQPPQQQQQQSTSSSNSHLAMLSRVRKNVAFVKSQNHNLLRRELQAHQSSTMEYGATLLKHLLETDKYMNESSNSNRPNLSRFTSQPQITSKMRFLMFDFIMCCHTRLRLSTPTLFLTFQIMDSYSSKFIVKSNVYQLLALTSLWISSKYWDSKNRTPTLDILRNLCCKQYTSSQFCEMELHLLKAFDWSFCVTPTYDSFIDSSLFLRNNKDVTPTILYQNQDVSDINKVKIGAVMLCELATFDINLAFNVPPSQLSICAVAMITLALKYLDTNELVNYENSDDLDESSKKICKSLLEMVSDPTLLPSTFKFKYLNEQSPSTSSSKKIIDTLSNYSIQIKMEEFYKSQEFSTFMDSLEKSKDTNNTDIFGENDDDDDITFTNNNDSNYISESDGRRRANHQHFSSFSSNNISSNSYWGPSPISTTPSSISFASPFSSTDRISSNTPDTVNSPYGDKLSAILSHNSTNSLYSFTNSRFPLPSPTTPVLLNNDIMIKRNNSQRRSRNWSVSSMKSLNSTRKPELSGPILTTSFVKGHHKRSSSTMDIDFFDSELNTKRQNR